MTAARALPAAVIGCAAIAAPFLLTPFANFQLAAGLSLAICVIGLTVLTGCGGQISLGHVFFFAVGGYVTAILVTRHQVPFVACLALGGLVCFALGLLLGVPALRLPGLYLPTVTIGLAVATPPLIKRFEGLTGGVEGIVVPAPSAPAGIGLADDQWLYFVTLVATVVALWLARGLIRSQAGRAIVALRDNELAATAFGIDPVRTKTLTFGYSAAFAGVGGGLYALVIGFASPDVYDITLTIMFVVALVVGGVESVFGAVLGALFIRFLPTWASDVSGSLSGLLFGAALIATLLVTPGGVGSLLARHTNKELR